MKVLKQKKITTPEIAALHMVVFAGEENWNKVFAAAAGEDYEECKGFNRLPQYASMWRHSQKVKNELQRLELVRDAMLQEERARAFEDGVQSAEGNFNTETEARIRLDKGKKKEAYSGMVDYTDPDMQKRKLNEIINKAADAGEALDALKVIIQGQRNDQEAAKDNQVQRFYTPIQCRDCPLYQEKKESLGK